jgi:sortase A
MTVRHRSENTISADDDLDLLQTLLEKLPQPRNDPRHPLEEQRSQVLLQTLLGTPAPMRDARPHPIVLHALDQQPGQVLGNYLSPTRFDTLLGISQRFLAAASLLVLGYWFIDGPIRDWAHVRQPALGASLPGATPVGANIGSASLHTEFTLPYALPETDRPTNGEDFIAPQQRTTDLQTDRSEAQPAQNDDFAAPGRIAIPARVAQVAAQPTHLLIPSITVDTPVVETFVVDGEWQVADYAAGYLHETGLPGDRGNMVIGGHLGLRGGVFRDLASLVPGADIYVDAAGWRYQYRVRESKSVWPNQTEVLYPTEKPTLTLLTCTNWDTQRLIVVADIVAAKPLPST